MLLRAPIRLLTLLTLLVGLAGEIHAVPVVVPTGLSPGDQYRLLFVTSTSIDATSTDIATYNAFVTSVANSVTELSALGTTWTAIASTATVDARDNTGTDPGAAVGVPVYSTNDGLLFVDNADIWDGLAGPPITAFRDEDGLSPSFFIAWTGTGPDGVVELALGTATPTRGFGGYSATKGEPPPEDLWVSAGGASYFIEYRLYGLSGVLTVVPEPGTLVLVLIGLAGYAASGRRFP